MEIYIVYILCTVHQLARQRNQPLWSMQNINIENRGMKGE